MKAFLAALIAGLFATQQVLAAGCTLPTGVSTRFGRGQIFDVSIPNLSVLNGTRDTLWFNSTGNSAPAATYSGFYIEGDRTPYIYVSHNLAWYEANDPTWIVYRPDRTTPAWEFCNTLTVAACDTAGYTTPVAIWLAAVQTFLEGADIQSAINAGIFQSISVDNADTVNAFMKAGTCSVAVDPTVGDCTHQVPPGVWTDEYPNYVAYPTATIPSGATTITVAAGTGSGFTNGYWVNIRGAGAGGGMYGGYTVVSHTANTVTLSGATSTAVAATTPIETVQNVSTQLHTDWNSWLSALATFLHTNSLCLNANMTWNDYDRSGWTSIVSNLDMIYDEPGFSTDSDSSYVPGGGYFQNGLYDDKFADYITAAKPAMIESTAAPPYYLSRARTKYSEATDMLLQNGNIYQMLWSNSQNVFEEFDGDTYFSYGAATGTYSKSGSLYSRAFANGLAIVNDSSTTGASYSFGGTVYHEDNGNPWTGTLSVPALTGLVLHSGAPTKIILTH
jgi:hypothetical protein